jgi:hypothetical protein
MCKKPSFLLVAALLLLPAASSSARTGGLFEALFCPECWEYLWGGGSLDMKGNCAACGKYPVQLEAQTARWWWCSHELKWLKGPCDENAARHCCAREESLAVEAPLGPKVFAAWYCPAHRSFGTVELPILGIKMCGTCARPAVPVHATKRAWYWCTSEGLWGQEPCAADPTLKCCTKREGLLLVKPPAGPMAGN